MKIIHFGDPEIGSGYQCYFLNYTVNTAKKLEFRVRYDGTGDMKCGGMIIFRIDDKTGSDKELFVREIITLPERPKVINK